MARQLPARSVPRRSAIPSGCASHFSAAPLEGRTPTRRWSKPSRTRRDCWRASVTSSRRQDYETELLDEAFFTIMAANLWTNLSGRAGTRPFGEADVEPVSWAYADAGRDVSAEVYIRAVQTFHRTGRRLGAFFERHDVLLSPTLARASLPLGAVRTDGALAAFRAQMAPLIAFTMVHNAAGTPAASVPLAWTADGLPIGVQVAARLSGEATLLALAAQLERARPWRQRRPPLAA